MSFLNFSNEAKEVILENAKALENEKRVWNEAGDPGVITKKLYDLLAGIQYADIEDEYKWVVKVEWKYFLS